MSNVIRIDDEVFAWLQRQAQAFVDTPNSVLRHVAGFDRDEGKTRLLHELTQTDEEEMNESWEGEYYYVSFGVGPHRRWNDAQRYGFISGGGGAWHTQTLKKLKQGDRVWVNIPQKGYVGVGRVIDSVVPFDRFLVSTEGGNSVPITDLPVEAPKMFDAKHNEHLVAVHWIKTLPVEHAVKEKGFFGNQNTVARPRDKKWDHTVTRLKEIFGLA